MYIVYTFNNFITGNLFVFVIKNERINKWRRTMMMKNNRHEMRKK